MFEIKIKIITVNNNTSQHGSESKIQWVYSRVLSGFRKQNNPLNKLSSRSYTWEAMFELLENAKQFPKRIKYLSPINIHPSGQRLLVLIISQTLTEKVWKVFVNFSFQFFARRSRLDFVVATSQLVREVLTQRSIISRVHWGVRPSTEFKYHKIVNRSEISVISRFLIVSDGETW